ncbi:MAG TPA: S9 family peptidase, partial [Vitreimonas sp.]|nr:S9 family peptidase [Vitreimonas sp.]
MRLPIFQAAFAALTLACMAACASPPTPTPAQQAAAPATTPAADPYLWLEDVEGARALAWVNQENARSLPVLQNDPRYAHLLRASLQVAQNNDRLPLGGIQNGFLYNFWQDAEHVRGIWRRATLASYASGHPRWETILDVDAVSRAENANWVFEGADCEPSGVRC